MTIALVGLLAGCTSMNQTAPGHPAFKPHDPTIPRSPADCIGVVVSFEGDEWMDADELRHQAKQLLRDQGHPLDDSYQCRMHIELMGKRTVCTVEFVKGFGDTIYFVEFNRRGEIQQVRSGLAVENPAHGP